MKKIAESTVNETETWSCRRAIEITVVVVVSSGCGASQVRNEQSRHIKRCSAVKLVETNVYLLQSELNKIQSNTRES